MKQFWMLKKLHGMIKPLSPSELDYFGIMFAIMLAVTIIYGIFVVLILF